MYVLVHTKVSGPDLFSIHSSALYSFPLPKARIFLFVPIRANQITFPDRGE